MCNLDVRHSEIFSERFHLILPGGAAHCDRLRMQNGQQSDMIEKFDADASCCHAGRSDRMERGYFQPLGISRREVCVVIS
jgi:hypothetical protein